MLIVKCANVENYEYAKTHGVWQQPTTISRGIKIGESFLIQLNGSDRKTLCRATSELYEDVPYFWPKQIEGTINTVRFTIIDTGCRGSHQYID